jgi:hypothetical protein
MPLEGQWARQQAPFVPSGRERRVFLILAALTLAVAIVTCWALIAGTQAAPHPGCTQETVASTTGGATIEHCR